jgi:hypothetical protein
VSEFWKASTPEQLENCFKHLRDNMPESGWRVEYRPWRDTRSLSQNALAWMWYEEIAKQVSAKTGMGPFDAQDIHDRLLVERYGWRMEQVGSVEVPRLPRTSRFDRGEMTAFLQWVEAWAADRGIRLTIPAHSEYARYREAQVA